ncbi:hypothetical protein DSW25_03020 [Sulfitobacter donghicola DSW-25 = KCTC 12864 = JCM 14565]|uniref:Uncharacterized protein n=1 Tax=Sulfitobacter donghicola DSW-25 = KCTC 12864 = JCM 14565 TaxID=1300350 RepID=A0A073J0B0_9RHOB|nr:hypothetical protein DSW25_03020 [Sulfitobacter donghicola DSW-25 = KCTC 12864 = JCM 14565]
MKAVFLNGALFWRVKLFLTEASASQGFGPKGRAP